MAPPKDMLKTKAENALSNNPSAIGDPISIKAESTTSEHDLSGSEIKDSQRKGDGKSLKEVAQASNPSMLGDPVSLKAETSDKEPTDQDRGALRDGKKKDSKLYVKAATTIRIPGCRDRGHFCRRGRQGRHEEARDGPSHPRLRHAGKIEVARDYYDDVVANREPFDLADPENRALYEQCERARAHRNTKDEKARRGRLGGAKTAAYSKKAEDKRRVDRKFYENVTRNGKSVDLADLEVKAMYDRGKAAREVQDRKNERKRRLHYKSKV